MKIKMSKVRKIVEAGLNSIEGFEFCISEYAGLRLKDKAMLELDDSFLDMKCPAAKMSMVLKKMGLVIEFMSSRTLLITTIEETIVDSMPDSNFTALDGDE